MFKVHTNFINNHVCKPLILHFFTELPDASHKPKYVTDTIRNWVVPDFEYTF
jgi:hypothetical protein